MEESKGKEVFNTQISVITFEDGYVDISDRHGKMISVRFKNGTPAYSVLRYLADDNATGGMERVAMALLTVPMIVTNLKFYEKYIRIVEEMLNDPVLFENEYDGYQDDETDEDIIENLETQEDAANRVGEEVQGDGE